ncbi:MAG: penicillin-binding transpeptidase domain-containing protein [Gammaproteobacteria bacterium]|nr:penicillin-binding transpeptidase domain-containing protein [Gammaproteobacteria bacterium]
MSHASNNGIYQGRRIFILLCMGLAAITLVWRAVCLQVLDKEFLLSQGEARHLRVVALPAHRGVIQDRNGEPLAVSTPVESVWVNPQELGGEQQRIPELAALLSLDGGKVRQLLARRADRGFVYLRRHLSPALAEQVSALKIPGVYLQREYRRYYPGGEVAAQIVGFTNVDDLGQEGLELAYEDWLGGEPGAKRVIKDGKHDIIEDVESISRPHPGKDLRLSLDRRIQYLAYRELKAVMKKHKALAASAVVLDVKSGEVLAMVNQPSFNPNNRQQLRRSHMRNRAVTDVFEPGSTMKPFIVAAALQSGHFQPETLVSTSPGWYRVGVNTVRDVHDYGQLDVTGVIRKSSNVGISKIALTLPAEDIWTLLTDLGFGAQTYSGFPGEASGLLSYHGGWNQIETATLAYGYGVSVTALQLAQAYGVLAADGIKRSVTFLHEGDVSEERRILPTGTVQQVRAMLEQATGPDGTAPQARVAGYRVAGKTGTVKKPAPGGYSSNKYLAVFAGMAPASDPRLVMVVMVDEPGNGAYYGGQVAAPVFSRVMSGALRLLAVPPDDLPMLETRRSHEEEPA